MQAAGKRYILHPSRSDVITIWNLADFHYGNKACALKHLKRDIVTIRDNPRAFWIGGGDYAEYIAPSDPRFDPSVIAGLSVEELGSLGMVLTSAVRDLLKPIKHKCLGLLMGNHEIHYQRTQQQMFLHSWLCCDLGVPNLEYSALLHVIFVRVPRVKRPRLALNPPRPECTRRQITLYAHHGAGGAQTAGGKMNRLVQFMQSFDADVYFLGHVHDQIGKRVDTVGLNPAGTELTNESRLGVISGSYLKTYAQNTTTYGEIRGYRPVSLGASYVKIRPETGEITGTI